jgi:hypothetical protein
MAGLAAAVWVMRLAHRADQAHQAKDFRAEQPHLLMVMVLAVAAQVWPDQLRVALMRVLAARV